MKALVYNLYDIDENLLFLQTPLHFKKNVNGEWIDIDIPPQEFAKIRRKYGNNYISNPEWRADPDYSFCEFHDDGPRGKDAFLIDFKKAIKEKRFGPSWNKLLGKMIEGRLFGIITTRGHEPATLRRAFEYIIYYILTKEQRNLMKENIKNFDKLFGIKSKNLIKNYLDKCYFIGLFSEAFHKQFGYYPSRVSLDKGKKDAINFFVQHVRKFAKRLKKHLKVGFSDDDLRFSTAAKELFKSLDKSLDIPESFYVFDTSNPKIKGGVRTKI